MRMPVQHYVDAACSGNELMGSDAQGRLLLAKVRKDHYVVGTFAARLIYSDLHQTANIVGTEVIKLIAVVVIERVFFADH